LLIILLGIPFAIAQLVKQYRLSHSKATAALPRPGPRPYAWLFCLPGVIYTWLFW
jgi:hypothetical protein